MAWEAMKSRCLNPNHKQFHRYGGRGICVCQQWHTFEAFLEDMGIAPDGMWLDRIDNNAGYNPANCQWATPIMQENNKRNNVRVEIDGVVKTVSQWCRFLGIVKIRTALTRIRRGWQPRAAVITPAYSHLGR